MASTDGLVPITRAFLASYYDKYIFSPLSDSVSHLSNELQSLSRLLQNHTPLSQAFLAMLAKNKAAASASDLTRTAVPETEGNSKVVTSLVISDVDHEASGASPVLAKDKDKDRKRHRDRDGTSSRAHHKRSKDAVAIRDDSVVLALESKVSSVPRSSLGAVVGSGLDSLRLCRGYVDKLAGELDRALKIKDDEGLVEVARLRRELAEAKSACAEAESRAGELEARQRASSERVAILLAENSNLISECDSMGATIKSHENSLEQVKKSVEDLKNIHKEEIEAVTLEKDEVATRLDQVKVELAQSQEESIKTFEEGYRVCWERLSECGLDVANHTFEKYLEELQKKIAQDEAGSSNNPGAGEV